MSSDGTRMSETLSEGKLRNLDLELQKDPKSGNFWDRGKHFQIQASYTSLVHGLKLVTDIKNMVSIDYIFGGIMCLA